MFGDPGSDGWGWKITGHHLAVNITVKGNQIGALPGYYGSNPRVVPDGPYAGFMALGSESELGMDLMTSLDLQQQARASIASETPQDVLAGPGRRGKPKEV